MRTEALIHCDPKVAFGEPMVRGARIVDLVDRVAAGDSITDTAEDFGVPVDELVLVLRVVDGAPDEATEYEPSDDDVRYERAQRSEAWERMGGGGL